MDWSVKEPKAGDIIRVKVRFYHHYGIYTGEDTVVQFGLPDNSGIDPAAIRVMESDLSTWAQYGAAESMVLSKEEKKRRRSPKETVAIARARIGEGGYNILHNNCEHFATDCVLGEKTSNFLEEVRQKIRMKMK